MRLRSLLLAAALLTGAVSLPASSAAPATDTVLMLVTVGDRPVPELQIDLEMAPIDVDGPFALVLGTGGPAGDGSLFGLTVTDPSRPVSTTRELGGVDLSVGPVKGSDHQVGFGFGFQSGLAARERVLLVVSVPGARFRSVSTPRVTTGRGLVTLTTSTRRGATITRVGDPGSEGYAAGTVLGGAGTQQTSLDLAAGAAGSFLLDTGATVSSWTAPNRKQGTFVTAGSFGTGDYSFAGPAGRWSFTWSGAVASVAETPLASFTVPVGSYWPWFAPR